MRCGVGVRSRRAGATSGAHNSPTAAPRRKEISESSGVEYVPNDEHNHKPSTQQDSLPAHDTARWTASRAAPNLVVYVRTFGMSVSPLEQTASTCALYRASDSLWRNHHDSGPCAQGICQRAAELTSKRHYERFMSHGSAKQCDSPHAVNEDPAGSRRSIRLPPLETVPSRGSATGRRVHAAVLHAAAGRGP